MSAANLSAGAAVRASGLPVETGPRSASTDAGAKSGFPDLLTKMAAAADRAPSQPAISATERRWAWGRAMSQAAPARGVAAEGGEPPLAAQPADELDPTVDAASVGATPQPAASPSPLDALGLVGVAPLSGWPLPTGQGRDAQAPSAAVPQGTRERLDVLASLLPASADAAALHPANADARAVVAAGAPSPQLVTVVGRETHFAPVAKPVLEQPQGFPAAAPLGASLEQPTSAATAAGKPDGAGDGSAARGGPAAGTDGSLAELAIEAGSNAANLERTASNPVPSMPARALTDLQWPQGRDATSQGLPGAGSGPGQAATGDGASRDAAAAGETAAIKGTRDSRARGIGVLQSAQERLSASPSQPAATGASTPSSTADATTPLPPPRDPRPIGGATAATQAASIAGEATRIAQAVQQVQAPAGRGRAERTAQEQGAEPGDSESLAARAGVPGAGRSLSTSPERLAVAKPGSEQDGAGDREAAAGSSAEPTERSVSVSASEAPRTFAAVPPPTHQVAGQIVTAANAVQSEGVQPAALGAKAAVASVVKVLHLELQPADMGTITIHMSLKQDGLDVRVEVSRPETACLLQGDQDTLAKLLTSAGYRIDGMAVVTAPTDSAALPDGRSQAFLPPSTPDQGGSSQSDSRPSSGRPHSEPDPRASRGNQNDDSTDKRRTARRAGGDVYV